MEGGQCWTPSRRYLSSNKSSTFYKVWYKWQILHHFTSCVKFLFEPQPVMPAPPLNPHAIFQVQLCERNPKRNSFHFQAWLWDSDSRLCCSLFHFCHFNKNTYLTKQLDFCLFQTDNGFFFSPLSLGCCFHLKGYIGCPCVAQLTTETEFTSNVPLGFT